MCYKKPQKREPGRVAGAEPVQSFAEEYQWARSYVAPHARGELRGRNLGRISGTGRSAWPARAERRKKAPSATRNPQAAMQRLARGESRAASSFIVAQSEFLLRSFIVALDDPAMLGPSHQNRQAGCWRAEWIASTWWVRLEGTADPTNYFRRLPDR
jgi:hypothetical protein